MKGIKEILEYKVVRNVKHDKYFGTAKKRKYGTFNGIGGVKGLLSLWWLYELFLVDFLKY